jgi:hypothetical protein
MLQLGYDLHFYIFVRMRAEIQFGAPRIISNLNTQLVTHSPQLVMKQYADTTFTHVVIQDISAWTDITQSRSWIVTSSYP